MFHKPSLKRLISLPALGLLAIGILAAATSRADTLSPVASASAQAANDSLTWSQKGTDSTVLAASFTANTALSNAVTVNMGAANSIISTVCSANPCSWTGTGFTAGHSLLWTSDAGNGGSGPVTLKFGKSIAGAGALIQADLPGAFTAQIQLYNGSTLLGSFSAASDAAGDPVYLGAIDQTGANITQVIFSLTACKSLCSDFGLDTVAVNSTAAASTTVSASPTSLTFGTTNVGATSAAQVVTVKNTGTTAVTFNSFTFTGTYASSYLLSAKTCTTSLAVGASCTLSVEFKPTTAGTLGANLAIADNATGSPQSIPLSGTATQPSSTTVAFSPTSLTFPSTAVGATSAAQVVTLKNTGTTAVTINSYTFAGTYASSYVLTARTCGTSLAVGASCTLSVAFKPATSGTLTATLNATDNATGSPQTVALSGTGASGTTPTLTVSPTSIAFPATITGTTSDAQIVTLTNTGSTTVTISSIALGGTNPTSFLELSNCGTTLASKATCSLYVAFKPTAAGALSATISITDTATGSPQKVTLTGTGTTAPSVKLSATSIAFPTTKSGTTSAAQAITLTNTGSATLTLTSIALTGTNPTDFEALDTCGATLAASASCTVYLAFKPAAVGSFSASLTVTDNGAASPQSVKLTGTGN
jgi:hypothetical protein